MHSVMSRICERVLCLYINIHSRCYVISILISDVDSKMNAHGWNINNGLAIS